MSVTKRSGRAESRVSNSRHSAIAFDRGRKRIFRAVFSSDNEFLEAVRYTSPVIYAGTFSICPRMVRARKRVFERTSGDWAADAIETDQKLIGR